MPCHGVLNMQEIKYGVKLDEMILNSGMKHGYGAMSDVHEETKVLINFVIHAVCWHQFLSKFGILI